MTIRTIITTKDGVAVAMQEREPQFVFVGHFASAVEAINAGPWLGKQDPDSGFFVSSVEAKMVSDWGSWWDWLLGRSKPQWLIKVSYQPRLAKC